MTDDLDKEGLLDFLRMIDYVERLPNSVLRSLAAGAWPEPMCGVCRSLDLMRNRRGDTWDRVEWLLRWHHAPLRQADLTQGYVARRELRAVCYTRCQSIYATARMFLDHRAKGVDPCYTRRGPTGRCVPPHNPGPSCSAPSG